MSKKKTIDMEFREDLVYLVLQEVPKLLSEYEIEKKDMNSLIYGITGLVRRYFDKAVAETWKRMRVLDNSWAEKQNMENRSVSDFLYWHTPLGGFPDSSIRIGVDFEVGGAYEDWGFVVEQKTKDGLKRITAGRTLEKAIESATKRIREEWEAKEDVKKCACGNKMAMYKRVDDKDIPICMECFVKA